MVAPLLPNHVVHTGTIAAIACDLSLAIVSVAAREYLPFGGSKTRHDLKS